MSVYSALSVGVIGLHVNSRQIENVSQNIANVNTVGYKENTVHFQEMMISDSGGNLTSFQGATSLQKARNSRQGLLRRTESATDLAVSGVGFFPVSRLALVGDTPLFTRAGSFKQDANGFFTNGAGFYLQGWALDEQGELPGGLDATVVDQATGIAALTPIQITQFNNLPQPTTNVELGINLQATQSLYAGVPAYNPTDNTANMASGSVSSAFNRGVTVVDANGETHDLIVSFLKTASNTWAVEIYPQTAADVTSASPIVSGNITFNGDGSLATVDPALAQPAPISWLNGAADSAVTFNWGTEDLTDGMSQFASNYQVTYVRQNGFEGGALADITITNEGYIIGHFSDDSERRLYKIPLAHFINPDQLESLTGNVFAPTRDNSEATFIHAGGTGSTLIEPSALEESNVELSEQYAQIIIAQRAYQSNTKTISTSDHMLETLTQMLRA